MPVAAYSGYPQSEHVFGVLDTRNDAAGLPSLSKLDSGGLVGDAAGFEETIPGTPLVFPRDFGAHPGFRTEWWYLTTNLEDPSGAAYGVPIGFHGSHEGKGCRALPGNGGRRSCCGPRVGTSKRSFLKPR